MKKKIVRKWANKLFPGLDLKDEVCTNCFSDPPAWMVPPDLKMKGWVIESTPREVQECAYCGASRGKYCKKLYDVLTSEKLLHELLKERPVIGERGGHH